VTKGDADGVLLNSEAEAEGVRKLLESQATGYAQLVSSCGGDTRMASIQLPDYLGKITEAPGPGGPRSPQRTRAANLAGLGTLQGRAMQ